MTVRNHKASKIVLLGLASLLLLLSSYVNAIHAFSNGQSASLVIGGFGRPDGVAFDSSGNLWVADGDYNRVVEFNPPFSSNEAPSVVIGQKSFTTFSPATTQTGLSHPENVVFDPSGNLWVTDFVNNRILEYKAPFSTGEAASLVIGQPDFTHSTSANSQTGLYYPLGETFDSAGNLWVGDDGNGRVLEFNAPFSTGEAASLVIGKPNFASTASAATQTTTSGAEVPAFDSSGNLWFADWTHSRVLEFKPPFSTGEAATLVIGQSNFTSGAPALTRAGLNAPDGATFDASGNLWVSDYLFNRVLEFKPPFSTGEAAALVIGQANFTSSGASSSTMGLNSPHQLSFDSSGNLWIPDAGNARLLEFSAPATTTVSQSSSTSASTASAQGGGIPEFPYQLVTAAIFTVLIVASFALARRRSIPRG